MTPAVILSSSNSYPNGSQPKRILVVEDDPELLTLYSLVLKKAGFKVSKADDGQLALNLMSNEQYDLVLLDVMLPKVDGFQILEALQKNRETKGRSRSVVLLTNMMHDSAVNRASKLGVQGYLVKSDYNPVQFLEKVKSYLHV